MIQRISVLLFVFFLWLPSSFAQRITQDMYALLGNNLDHEELNALLRDVEKHQITEHFNPSIDEYEINLYGHGYAMIFNHNFLFSGVQYYDSGYLYQQYDGKLPMGLKFSDNIQSFLNNKRVPFEVDSLNPFIYEAQMGDRTVKVYFRDGHIELVKVRLNGPALTQLDADAQMSWGMRLMSGGQCVDGGCYNKEGVMIWPGGLQYQGEWLTGVPHGSGRFSDTSGIRYIGSLKLGFLWGNGVLTIPNNFTYEGRFMYGKKNGFGTAKYANKTRYEGEWLNDKMHGHGHYWFSENYHYEGQFRNNQFNGSGKLTSPNGYVEGSFKNGKPNGFCKQVVNGTRTELKGYWIDGKKEGKFELYSPLSGTRELFFKNDEEVPQ